MKAFLAAFALMLLVPSVAAAAPHVEVSGTQVTLTGDAEKNEIVVVEVAPGILRFSEERTGLISAGSGCAGQAPDPPEILVDCPFDADHSLRFSLAGGDDTAEVTTESPLGEIVISGGSGDDQLHSTAGARLIGSTGNDTLNGGFFNDVLAGGLGSDRMVGGLGDDTASYADGRTSGVTANLAGGLADDGNALDADEDGRRDVIDDTVENLDGGPGSDTLTGNGDDNVLTGGDGVDDLHGEAGEDALDGGDMGDELDGGPGVDGASYGRRAEVVNVTIDAVRNDGGPADGFLPSQRDNVLLTVENVTGGDGDDSLIGHFEANDLRGGRGNDRLDGGTGPDRLEGGAGTGDVVSYAARTEPVEASLDGAAGDGGTSDGSGDLILGDVEGLQGGAGPDLLTGGAGTNSLSGGAGDDELRARDDTADALVCAVGSDLAVVDPLDSHSDCENVDLPPVPAPPGGQPPPDPDPPTGNPPPAGDVTAPRLSGASVRRKQLRFLLSEPARVVVRLERLRPQRRSRTVARLTIAGRTGVNRARLRRSLPRGGYRMTLTATDTGGNRSRPLRLRFRL